MDDLILKQQKESKNLILEELERIQKRSAELEEKLQAIDNVIVLFKEEEIVITPPSENEEPPVLLNTYVFKKDKGYNSAWRWQEKVIYILRELKEASLRDMTDYVEKQETRLQINVYSTLSGTLTQMQKSNKPLIRTGKMYSLNPKILY